MLLDYLSILYRPCLTCTNPKLYKLIKSTLYPEEEEHDFDHL